MNNQLKINDTILVTIKRLGINGEGIGYYKRMAVFVENALPEEVVEVKIVDTKEKYATGSIVKFKTTSTHRIEPKCPYYGKCGGCQLQHLDYPMQLVEKKNMTIEAFERYYDGNPSKIKFNDTLGMTSPWRYRNKSSLPTRHDGHSVVTGMYAKDSNHLVYISDCLVENELIQTTRTMVLNVLSRAQIDVYNAKTRIGSLRYLVIRAFEDTQETQVTFVLTQEDRKIIRVLEQLTVTSTNYSINSDPKSIDIFGSKIIHVAGKEQINGNLGAFRFSISPSAFFQLNSKQTSVLYEEIKSACKLTGTESILDCYCGIGSIGMMLAPFAKEVRGIDTNKEGIEDAKIFARMNGVNNITFYAGNIIPFLHQFEEKGFIPDIVVLDPPRQGLELNLINYLQKSKIKRIIYVSCNPATLAKNINHLQKEYIIRYVTPIDMFPQTSNVEAVCLLERR